MSFLNIAILKRAYTLRRYTVGSTGSQGFRAPGVDVAWRTVITLMQAWLQESSTSLKRATREHAGRSRPGASIPGDETGCVGFQLST